MKFFIDILTKWFFKYKSPKLGSKTEVNERYMLTVFSSA